MPKKKSKKSKVNMANMRCFAMNMICHRLDMPGRDFECEDRLVMQIRMCKRCKPKMCIDRINVVCMPTDLLCEFAMEPDCLQKQLAEGIIVTVKYMGREIGKGCYLLPDSVVERMCNTLQEVSHIGNIELTCQGCTVGMAQLRITMRMRCGPMHKILELCNSGGGADDLKSSLDTDDFSCLTGGSSQSCPTSSTDPCAGLGFYESQSASNSCCNKKFCMPIDCDEPPKKLVDMAGPYSMFSCPPTGENDCIQVEAAPGPCAQFALRSILGEGNTNRACQKISQPRLTHIKYDKPQRCSVCKEDVSWLPKIAVCPYCGYKPVPQTDENTYDECATAEGIINSHLQNPLSEAPSFLSVDGCSVVAEDMEPDAKTSEGFENIVQDYQYLKQSIKKARKAEQCQLQPRPNKAYSVESSNAGDKRPHLANVFDELKELFTMRDGDPKKRIKQICDEACKLSKTCKASRKSKVIQECVPEDPCKPLKSRKKRVKCRKLPIKSRVYSAMSVRTTQAKERHAQCFDYVDKCVPSHMGWLWTQCPLAKFRGWRPGAIRRSIRELMTYFLKDYPVDSIPVSKYMSYHRHKKPPPKEDEEKPEDLIQVPTLHIEKKNDEYIITLRPLKDPKSLLRAANPYVDMKPVQFRIVKNPLLKQLRDMKRCLKNMGYSKCKCHRPVLFCYCRSFVDKKRLLDEVKRECDRRQMANCREQLVLSDTTDSEAEYDFGVTPPAGLMKPERLKKSHVINTETQYDENDWAMPTMFPHPPNALVQYSGCAGGERKHAFKWIYGKGNVHAEKKPPKMRNKPKKKPKKRIGGGFASESVTMLPYVEPQPMAETDEPFLETTLTAPRMKRLAKSAYPPMGALMNNPRHVTFAKQLEKYPENM